LNIFDLVANDVLRKGTTVEFVYSEQAYSEVKINPWSHRYLNNVFVKAYYKFFITKSGL